MYENAARRDKVFELRECWITSPLVVEITQLTQRFAREKRQSCTTDAASSARAFLTVRHPRRPASAPCNLIAVASGPAEGLGGRTSRARCRPEVKTRDARTQHPRTRNVAFMEEESRAGAALTRSPSGCWARSDGVSRQRAFLRRDSAAARAPLPGADAAQLTGRRDRARPLPAAPASMTLLFACRREAEPWASGDPCPTRSTAGAATAA